MSLEDESYVSMNELFPEVTEDKRAGVILAGARGKEGMTQKQLAEKCGIPQSHISEMERAKRPIGLKTAKILGAALNIGYKVFL